MQRFLKFIAVSLLFATGLFSPQQPLLATEAPALIAKQDYTVMAGEWQRTDSNYFVTVTDVQIDGRAKVEYFNPKPIHVEKAAISTQKNLIKLFIQLQDSGYEGSSYTLYYHAEKDALAGFYYQAPLNRTYEVVFLRRGEKGK